MTRKIALFIIFSLFTLCSQPLLSPAVTDNSMSALGNPAATGIPRSFNVQGGFSRNSDNAFLTAGGRFFSAGYHKTGNERRYIAAQSNKVGDALHLGINASYIDVPEDNYQNYNLGFLYRPFYFLSLGAYTKNLITDRSRDYAKEGFKAGAALRPPFSNSVTFFSDGFYSENEIKEYSIGVLTDIPFGSFYAKVNDAEEISAGAVIGIGPFSAGHTERKKDESSGNYYFSFYKDINKTRYYPPVIASVTIDGSLQDGPLRYSIFGDPAKRRVSEIISQLRKASSDKSVKGVLIKIGEISSGFAFIEEIRNVIKTLSDSGKKTVCHLENAGMAEYYLASACSEIYMEPMGYWNVTGPSAQILFYSGFFEKLGIEADFVRIGDYKSAVEPFTRDSMSEEFRKNETALIEGIYSSVLENISNQRNIGEDSLRSIFDNGILSISKAKEAGLIDGKAHYEDLLTRGSLAPIVFGARLRNVNISSRTYFDNRWKSRNKIAVIHVEGPIISGRSFSDIFSGTSVAGARTVSEDILRAARTKAIKAVVLRINSPGGSGTASDIIWNAVKTAKEETGKPVIVSTGNVAASGGYYIACNADKIFCGEGSILGSIGIYTGKLVFKGLFEKLGLGVSTVKTSEASDAMSSVRKYSEEERERIRESLLEFYEEFVRKVSEGRGIDPDKIKKELGGGRVFSGDMAVENGLADEIGGLDKAIAEAGKMAGLEYGSDIEIESFPKFPGPFFTYLTGPEKRAASFLKLIRRLERERVYALMPPVSVR